MSPYEIVKWKLQFINVNLQRILAVSGLYVGEIPEMFQSLLIPQYQSLVKGISVFFTEFQDLHLQTDHAFWSDPFKLFSVFIQFTKGGGFHRMPGEKPDPDLLARTEKILESACCDHIAGINAGILLADELALIGCVLYGSSGLLVTKEDYWPKFLLCAEKAVETALSDKDRTMAQQLLSYFYDEVEWTYE